MPTERVSHESAQPGGPKPASSAWTRPNHSMKRVLQPVILAGVLLMAGCRGRTVVVTQEVTREVTVVVPQASTEGAQSTAQPLATEATMEGHTPPSPVATVTPPGLVAGLLAPYPNASLCPD